MKYLVVSDNHGDREILVELVEKYEQHVDYLLHCGDSELEDTDSIWEKMLPVSGNCDYYGDYPVERVIDTGVDRIYITHGHRANVRFGLNQLALKAEAENCNLIFFGHTHQIGCEMVQQRLFLNPGSISQPRGTILIPSYAIIDSQATVFDVQYFNRAHHPIEELHFIFEKK